MQTAHKTLETLSYHFNPLNDVMYLRQRKASDGFGKVILDSGYNLLNMFIRMPKHLVRGAFIGSLAGSFATAVSGGPVTDGAVLGTLVGAALDWGQFGLRTMAADRLQFDSHTPKT